MTHQFNYNVSQSPAQPIMEITLISPESGRAASALEAVIDSGADASLVPVHILQPLAPPLSETRRVRSLWGEKREFKSFIIEVRIGAMILPGVEVLGYSGDEIILGRDILNKLWLELDGPAQVTEVAEKRPRRR